jgi:hypothetical protein
MAFLLITNLFPAPEHFNIVVVSAKICNGDCRDCQQSIISEQVALLPDYVTKKVIIGTKKSQHPICLVVNQYFIVLISRIGKYERCWPITKVIN